MRELGFDGVGRQVGQRETSLPFDLPEGTTFGDAREAIQYCTVATTEPRSLASQVLPVGGVERNQSAQSTPFQPDPSLSLDYPPIQNPPALLSQVHWQSVISQEPWRGEHAPYYLGRVGGLVYEQALRSMSVSVAEKYLTAGESVGSSDRLIRWARVQLLDPFDFGYEAFPEDPPYVGFGRPNFQRRLKSLEMRGLLSPTGVGLASRTVTIEGSGLERLDWADRRVDLMAFGACVQDRIILIVNRRLASTEPGRNVNTGEGTKGRTVRDSGPADRRDDIQTPGR